MPSREWPSRLGVRDGRGEIVDDEAPHDTAEEGPGGHEAVEGGAEILPPCRRRVCRLIREPIAYPSVISARERR